MKLENQVCSLELAQKLKELGVKQESIWIWKTVVLNGFRTTRLEQMGVTEDDYPAFWSAFTVAELGEMLKQTGLYSGYSEEDLGWYCQSSIHNKFDIIEQETEADARAKMLIYLLENKLIETV